MWRANIILATADGCGTAEVMRRSGKSKPVVWRWQARFMAEGVEGLMRDKTRKPGKQPLSTVKGTQSQPNKCEPTVVLRSKSDDLFVRTGRYLTVLLQDDKNLIACLPQSSSVAIDAEEASAVVSFETATWGTGWP